MAENRDKYLQLDEVIQQNKGKQGAVMITLQAAQNIFEHVPRDVQVRIAAEMGIRDRPSTAWMSACARMTVRPSKSKLA